MRNIAFILLTIVAAAACQAERKLVWSDEFDVDGGPDLSRWNYEVGMKRNKEAQYYTEKRPQNARVEEGCLILEARKEAYKDAEYTSASLHTRDTATWTYGRYEVSAKVPQGVGVWPAIWMLGANIKDVGWPKCGEIDIMEYVGFDPNTIHANIHCKKYNHKDKTGKGATVTVKKPWTDFHVYAIEWTPEKIDFFVDNKNYFSFQKEDDPAAWPFDKPHYLILNLAIGGTWGGEEGIDDSIFPQQYVIDYVRVYQDVSMEPQDKP